MPERTQTGWRSKFADNNFGSIKQNDDQSVDFDFCLVFDLGDSEKKVKLKKDGVTMSQSERYSRVSSFSIVVFVVCDIVEGCVCGSMEDTNKKRELP